jgi:Fic family protein
LRRFDYSFLESGMLPANLLNTISSLSELKVYVQERKPLFTGVFSSLERIARVQSVKGSNEIEGIVTSEQRINEIVNQNSAPLNHSEEEIAGYRDALNLIHTGYPNIEIGESSILGLHKVMLSFTAAEGGKYKISDNTILEIDTFGKRRVRFSPIPAKETAEAMEQMVLAYIDSKDNYGVNQLLLIPCFILDFLCIHPFADGNGRLSRLLSLLLLYKSGFDIGKYISFEAQINKTKSGYYEALKASSAGWHTNENSYFSFIKEFLITLLLCYKELDKRFAIVNNEHLTKAQRIEATVLDSLIPVSKKEIADLMPDISPTTIEAVLANMLKNGSIMKMGMSRNTKYLKKSKDAQR